MFVCSGEVGGEGVHDEQSNRYGCITVHAMDGSGQFWDFRRHRWMVWMVNFSHTTSSDG